MVHSLPTSLTSLQYTVHSLPVSVYCLNISSHSTLLTCFSVLPLQHTVHSLHLFNTRYTPYYSVFPQHLFNTQYTPYISSIYSTLLTCFSVLPQHLFNISNSTVYSFPIDSIHSSISFQVSPMYSYLHSNYHLQYFTARSDESKTK